MTAIDTTKESWCDAEANRVAGEIARLRSLIRGNQKHISCARLSSRVSASEILGTPRRSEPCTARSWSGPIRSRRRLWRDQGEVNEARELPAPVYG